MERFCNPNSDFWGNGRFVYLYNTTRLQQKTLASAIRPDPNQQSFVSASFERLRAQWNFMRFCSTPSFGITTANSSNPNYPVKWVSGAIGYVPSITLMHGTHHKKTFIVVDWWLIHGVVSTGDSSLEVKHEFNQNSFEACQTERSVDIKVIAKKINFPAGRSR